jgi:hypothetical protein
MATRKKARAAVKKAKAPVKRAVRKTTAPAVSFQFNGLLTGARDRKGQLQLRILASRADARAYGLDDWIDKLFPPDPTPPGCATIGEVKPQGLWIYCIDMNCTASGGEECILSSWLPGGKDPQDHGGGTWFVPGRIYSCGCIYFG